MSALQASEQKKTSEKQKTSEEKKNSEEPVKNKKKQIKKKKENIIDDMEIKNEIKNVFYQNNNPDKYSVINYICDYDGFSLLDLYSYDFKHNESNGENNKDGNDLNYSWNCGHEGDTKKKNVINIQKARLWLDNIFRRH